MARFLLKSVHFSQKVLLFPKKLNINRQIRPKSITWFSSLFNFAENEKRNLVIKEMETIDAEKLKTIDGKRNVCFPN
jgi:hypothetical protein